MTPKGSRQPPVISNFDIAIPRFFPRDVKIITAIYFASIGISDQAFGSRSDQQYVPTLRTFLRLKCFLFGSGAQAPGDLPPKIGRFFFPANFPREFSQRIFPANFLSEFSP